MDITNVIEAFIALICAVLTAVVIPWIKSKVNTERLSECEKWVKIAVQSAEMLFPEAGSGVQKKDYVFAYLLERLTQHNITFDVDDINNMIESAVLEINRMQY